MKYNNAAARTIEIIEYMSDKVQPVTLTEIAQHCNIPKSSALDLLYTLQEKGIAQIDNEQFKTYKLTLKLFRLGSTVLNNNDLQSVSGTSLQELAARTNSTVFLAVPQNDRVVYVNKYEGDIRIQSSCMVGTTNPMSVTGIGKAMLASYSDEQIKKIVGDGPFERRTEHSITTFDALMEDLRLTRERGYAIDDREGVDVIYCYAAPVYDRNGKMVAAISNVNVYSDLNEKKRREYPVLVMDTAMKISRELGFMGNKLFPEF